MALFEIYEIDKYIGQESSTILKDIFLVAFGFGLAEGANWLRKRGQVTKIGESFDLELASLKDALKKQIAENKSHSELIINYNGEPPTFYIFKNLDFVKSLDRHSVNEYYRLRKKKADPKQLRSIYNSFNVIEAELERLMKFYEEYNFKVSSFYREYMQIANRFARSMGDFEVKNSGALQNDEFFRTVATLLKSTLFAEKTIENIMPFEESLHRKLISIVTHTHLLYPEMIEFNHKGIDIIAKIKLDTDNYKKRVDNLTVSLERCYKSMFNEN